jgi:hypothetical protein
MYRVVFVAFLTVPLVISCAPTDDQHLDLERFNLPVRPVGTFDARDVYHDGLGQRGELGGCAAGSRACGSLDHEAL